MAVVPVKKVRFSSPYLIKPGEKSIESSKKNPPKSPSESVQSKQIKL